MKPAHLLILAMVAVAMLYLVSVAVSVRGGDDEAPRAEDRRSFDASASFAWIGTLQAWLAPTVTLDRDGFDMGRGERVDVALPASDTRYRRLALEVTEPASLRDAAGLSLTYFPETRGGEDYPDDLVEPMAWPEEPGDLPEASFVVLNGGGILRIVNHDLARLRVEVR